MSLRSIWSRWQLKSQGRDFLKALRKQRVYNADLLPPGRLEEVRAYEAELGAALKGGGGVPPLQAVLEKGDRLAGAAFPSRKWDAVRENVEVIFVAIVAALALRAYFLQPFKIPTDSMKPTLYGIQVDPTDAAPPALPVRLFQQFVFGRTYGLVRFDHPVTLVGLEGGQLTPWFEYTDLFFDTGERRRVWAAPAALVSRLGLRRDQSFAANQDVVRFVKQTGDQVLVDKMSYHFRLPRRGEVFVFRTTHIAGIEDALRAQGIDGSEFYIKRCVGLPGDLLRVVPPNLEINGTTEGQNAAIRRVEAARDGYRGYSGLLDPARQHFLRTPQEVYQVGADQFWAMGDNSFNSLDSRFWGTVPRANLVGTGFVVYWPFGPRWGFIH